MDIELLSRMVGDLILSHDSVGLPGLGSFVAEIAPASFSDRGYTINPPYRRLSFYSGYPSDDVLASRYAESNGIGLPEAKAIISDYAAQMKQVLHSHRTVIFPGLGRLRATKDGTLFFVADEGLDIFPDGFTLEPVSLKSHDESAEAVAQAVSHISELIASQTIPPSDTQSAPKPESKPATPSDLQPVAAPEPIAAPEPQPAPEPESPSAPVPDPEHIPVLPGGVPGTPRTHVPVNFTGRRRRRWWIPVVATIGAAAVLLGAFAVLGRLAPDFVDRLLYTPEELEILNY